VQFTFPVACSSCGCNFSALGYLKGSIPRAVCPQCGMQIHFFDHLSISVLADRLLLRSQNEIHKSDFTVSILFSAIAVECALSQVFLKWRGLDHLRSEGRPPIETEQSAHEREYKKNVGSGGFVKSANFVSVFLVGKNYDEFVAAFIEESKTAELIKAGFPQYESQIKSNYIHAKLFAKRNRIMHWGEVSYAKDDASDGLTAAATAISVLKAMDKRKYSDREQAWRLSQNNPP